jgi:pyruvate formate lyase activating enzyme
MKAKCPVCPHGCILSDGQTGLCGARKNEGGEVRCINYGKITSCALDPIEKKPLMRFYPEAAILSVGSFGCNLRCGFCQNHQISMASPDENVNVYIPPAELVEKALEFKEYGNIGIAFTYNEPLIGIEYVEDCSVLAHEKNLKTVLVTNGYICDEPFKRILPRIDALNIDLKGFTGDFYKKLGGDLETVKRTIMTAAGRAHVEITTLVIPGENDGEDEMAEMTSWIAGIDASIPLHLSRFFPRYKYSGRPTPVETLNKLADIARKKLKHVYIGNV